MDIMSNVQIIGMDVLGDLTVYFRIQAAGLISASLMLRFKIADAGMTQNGECARARAEYFIFLYTWK